jgi:FkbM family methyltransferase
VSANLAAPRPGRPTTYRGLHDMAEWWSLAEREEEPTARAYQPFIRPGCLCFDIGANRGRKTLVMRKLGARVLAVDPLFAFGDEFMPEFHWKFGGDPEVLFLGRAISSRLEVTISINRFMPEYSSTDSWWMTESAHAPRAGQPYYIPTSLIERRVRAVTLDALIAVHGPPRFLKTDVEGAEDDVIATLSTPVLALNMEFHQDWIPITALEHMDNLAPYRWNYCLDERPEFVMPEWTCRGRLLDYLKTHLTLEGDGSWGDIYGRLD